MGILPPVNASLGRAACVCCVIASIPPSRASPELIYVQESCWYSSEQMPLNQPPGLLLLLHNPSGMRVHTSAGLPVFSRSAEETIKDNRYLG